MITAPNFTLREWRLSDAASIAEHANNIRIWENLRDALPHPYSEADGMTFIGMALAQPKPATLVMIPVVYTVFGARSLRRQRKRIIQAE